MKPGTSDSSNHISCSTIESPVGNSGKFVGSTTKGGDQSSGSEEKYFAPLQGRLEAYGERWKVKTAHAVAFVPTATPVNPEWLEAMARQADLTVWQLDHER